jgi:hypothetical protein
MPKHSGLLKRKGRYYLNSRVPKDLRSLYGKQEVKDEAARAWYLKYDFESSPTDPLHLFLLLKDIRALVGSGR